MVGKNLNKNKGSSLIAVILMITVLIILGSALITSALQNLKISKSDKYIDYAYYAADSAIEKCIDNIYQVSKPSQFTSGLTYNKSAPNGERNFAESVVDKIRTDAAFRTSYTGIDVAGNMVDTASANVSIQYIGHRYRTAAPGKMVITIGITANATYNNPVFGGGSKEVFAQREFEVYLPRVFKLDAAIKSIGDLFVKRITATISGGVNIYGTSPEKANQPLQYYYGGICARDNAVLDILNGNTYTRSFIRSGLYGGADGGNEIHVEQDAVAQCIQSFGYGDVIAVYRNAYTFDDIEMNAENSIIAVNGNYFGLSKGGMHHDESSAVVNSATVHFLNSNASKMSRIVINGDILLGGGTFRTDPLGVTYQIEDASIAWSHFMQLPTYKLHNSNDGPYDVWVKGQNDARGFVNLFQVWDIVQDMSQIGTWLGKVKNSRMVPNLTDPNNPVYNATGSFDHQNPVDIAGFCNYEMAANDTMYFLDETDEISSNIKHAKNLTTFYPLDSVLPSLSGVEGCSWGSYKGAVYSLLDEMKSNLSYTTDDLVTRDTTSSPPDIKHDPTSSPDNSDSVFKSLEARLNEFDPATNTHIIKVPVGAGAFNVNGYISANSLPTGAGDYYLVINNDPETDLVVDGGFKGIIFSMGKVILRPGADIYGAVIAAGRGFTDSGSYVAGSAADSGDSVPRVMENGDNLDEFNNGEYAAVSIEGSDTAQQARITFPGRDALVQSFESLGIDLNSIFY